MWDGNHLNKYSRWKGRKAGPKCAAGARYAAWFITMTSYMDMSSTMLLLRTFSAR